MSPDRNEWRDAAWVAGVLGAVTVPLLLALLLTEVSQTSQTARLGAVVAYVAVLFADLLLYLHWRMSGGPTGWLVLALTALTVQSLALAGVVASDPSLSETHPTRIVLVQGLVAAGVLALVALARRVDLRVDPLAVGSILGLTVVVVRYLLMAHTEPMHLSPRTMQSLNLTVLLLDLVIAAGLLRLAAGPTWVRLRLGCALVLLSIGHAGAYPPPRGVALSVVVATTDVLGATVLLTLAIGLVQTYWSDNRATLEVLGRRLQQVEADARHEEARLHELRATVAGLSSASRLIHQHPGIGAERRQQIEDMLDSEMERLRRLLTDESTSTPELIDLDETIRPIVTRHQALGYPVSWTPSGERAVARADDVAEVVNVLLQNAVRHAPAAGASISTRRTAGAVEIAVSDSGPGVDDSLRSKIFEWGERGHGSCGSGIGLNVARQLTVDLGGYLRLVESSTPGATFVLGLPLQDAS